MRRVVGNPDVRNLARNVDDEIAFHVDMRAQKLVESGMNPEEARAEALRQFGNIEAVRVECIANDQERARAQRRAGIVDELKQNLVYTLRVLRRNAGFAAGVVLTLGLGIGANVSIFALVNAVLLERLPVSEPERLVAIGNPSYVNSISNSSDAGGRTDHFNWEHYKRLRSSLSGFSGILASGRADRIQLRADPASDEAPRSVRSRYVSGNYFQVLGVPAARGRTLEPSDDETIGGAAVAVISHALWQREFGAAPDVAGRNVVINSAQFTVVGVAPPGFTGEIVGQNTDMWLPLTMQPVINPMRDQLNDRQIYWLLLVGRRAEGTSFEQAKLQVETTVRQIVRDATSGLQSSRESDVYVSDGSRGLSAVRGTYSRALITLLAGVSILLLIICANVANLLLARAVTRGREMSLRMAIGAGRARLVRQLLSESAVLALAGAVLGLALSYWGSRLLLALHADGGNRLFLNPGFVAPVLIFTLGLAAITVVLFGLVPAFQGSRVDLASALRSGSRGAAGGGVRHPMGASLIVAQVALSLALLVGAALLVHNLQNIQNQDTGLDRDHLIIADVDARSRGYEGDKLRAMLRDLSDLLSSVPGVKGVTYSVNGIFSGSESAMTIQVPGFTATADSDTLAFLDEIGPGYFNTIGASLVRGREFSRDDLDRNAQVAIINKTMAQFFFGNTDPLERTFRTNDSTTVRIIGVVNDVKDQNLTGDAVRRFYLPLQSEGVALSFIVRTTADPAPLVEDIQRRILEFDAEMPVRSTRTLTYLMRLSVRSERLLARLASGFGTMALVLAALGLYGVMNYAVTRRTGEIGLRLALGAQRPTVIAMVLKYSLTIVAIGIALGIPLAYVASRLLRYQLYAVSGVNLLAFMISLAVLISSAVIAAFIPAWRASRVAPLIALRHD